MEYEVVEPISGVYNTFLSPSVRKLYISATELEKDYFSVDEIKNYIDLKNLTLMEDNLAQLLEELLDDTIYDHNSRLISSEKIKHKDADFYRKSLKRLCPIFYMCHLALTFSTQINKEGNAESEVGTTFPCQHNDELVSWVSDHKALLGRMDTLI